MGDIGTAPQERVINESSLLAHIQCELHTAYDQVRDDAAYDDELNAERNIPANNSIAWLDKWGVKVNLEFQVEAKSAISPGLAITHTLESVVKPFKTGPVTIGRAKGSKFGASLTSDITRTETIAYFFPFSNFTKRQLPSRAKNQPPPKYDVGLCTQKTHISSDDDLQIYDFLHSKIELAETTGVLGQSFLNLDADTDKTRPGGVRRKASDLSPACDCKSGKEPEKRAHADASTAAKSPFGTLSYDVHFVVTKAFSATPTWKLMKVAIDADGSLYAGSRVKSDHMTMTFGAPDADKPNQASDEVNQQHFARLIGQYVGDSIKNSISQ